MYGLRKVRSLTRPNYFPGTILFMDRFRLLGSRPHARAGYCSRSVHYRMRDFILRVNPPQYRERCFFLLLSFSFPPPSLFFSFLCLPCLPRTGRHVTLGENLILPGGCVFFPTCGIRGPGPRQVAFCVFLTEYTVQNISAGYGKSTRLLSTC